MEYHRADYGALNDDEYEAYISFWNDTVAATIRVAVIIGFAGLIGLVCFLTGKPFSAGFMITAFVLLMILAFTQMTGSFFENICGKSIALIAILSCIAAFLGVNYYQATTYWILLIAGAIFIGIFCFVRHEESKKIHGMYLAAAAFVAGATVLSLWFSPLPLMVQ